MSTSLYPFTLTHDALDVRTGLRTMRERMEGGGAARTLGQLWDVFEVLAEDIAVDTAWAAGRTDFVTTQQNVVVATTATVHPSVVLDASGGPIVIDHDVVIEPFVVINGPVAIGRGTIVRSFATLRGPVVIGPVCKVGGEIECSVIHGYSNKQHEGFLGHSYIGEWCNLGAGTTTSDLKNTYGSIRVTIDGDSVDTGRMFIGTLMGDHTKTAIGTTLSTGTVIGACCNIAVSGFPATSLPSFTWCTDSGAEVYQIDKAINVARTVMQRRGMTFTPAHEAQFRQIAARSHA